MEADSYKREPLFGTSGIRGVVGEDLPLELCTESSRALGSSLPASSCACLATDSRESRETVKDAVISGLLSSGIDVVDLGILPTPALALLTREMSFDAGVMITASHNPPQYNGIKLFNRDATGYSRAQEEELEKLYFRKKFRQGKGALKRTEEGIEKYFSFIERKIPPGKLARELKLVIDPGNGAASGFATEIFRRMGLRVIPLNDEADGRFPGRNPEPKEDTLTGTIEFLRQQDADLAICFDGDADRVVFCDREGFLGFDPMIAFISRIMIEKTKRKTIATTVESGKLIDSAINDLGGEVVRGRVGDVNVAHSARERNAALGAEGVGVYIFPELGYYPDSFFATLTLLSELRDPGQIREFLQSLPPLCLSKTKVPCPNELKESVMKVIREAGPSLMVEGERPEVNAIDGVRLEFPDSWMLIRPSGTEPAIRIIAESASRAQRKER